jgi:N-formylglutamate amidohydrolase
LRLPEIDTPGFDSTARSVQLSAMKCTKADDSQRSEGGTIPGSGGLPAFALAGPVPSALPVLIAVPHAGRAYTGPLLDRMRNPDFAALRLEDRYVDRLAEGLAQATGALLLTAQAPRAMIDLNRAPDDIDWEMFAGRSGADVGSYTPGRRSRSGLGLIPRRLPGIGELWKRRHDEAELAQRIAGIHEPYHACLAAELEALRRRWGAALLLDLHSMPSLPARGRQPGPEFVLGDRFGASCHGRLVGAAFSFSRFAARRAGRRLRGDDPAAGRADPKACRRSGGFGAGGRRAGCRRRLGRSCRIRNHLAHKARGGQGSGRRCTKCTKPHQAMRVALMKHRQIRSFGRGLQPPSAKNLSAAMESGDRAGFRARWNPASPMAQAGSVWGFTGPLPSWTWRPKTSRTSSSENRCA